MICAACQAPHQAAQRFCGACGAALHVEGGLARDPAVPPDVPVLEIVSPDRAMGERRDVAILFADLTNFTGLSTEIDAEDLHTIIRSYTRRVDAVVHAFGGVIERYIGDSVMAVFGAPVAHGDDALRSVRAALAIQSEVLPALSLQFGRTLQASIGICFGEVMFTQGEAGHPEGLAVVGEAVNLAARVQGQAGAGNIVVSDTLHSACGPRLQAEFCGEQLLKGIARNVRLYRVGGLLDAAQGVQSRLRGRDSEMKVMRGAVAQCAQGWPGRLERPEKSGNGQWIHFRGEPGIGKSRLLEELQSLGQAAGLATHGCAYLDFGLEQTLSGMSALVASLLGLQSGGGVEARRAALARAVVSGLLHAEDTPFAVDVLQLPQIAADRAVLDALETGARRAALQAFVLKLVTDAARRCPLLLTVEDIHWMPASEIEQLVALCGLARTEPVMVATATRVVGDPLRAYLAQPDVPASAQVLEIGPISATAARQIALEFNADHQQAIESSIAQADGNPLFLEQLLRHAAETGKTTVPGSIHNVVLARLDRLPALDRHAAQCAAVIGQRFGLGLLRQLLPNLGYDPDSLVLANIIKRHGVDWIFAHALVQESAYGSLLHSAARAMHREAAAYYRPIDLILCAQHLDRAKAPEAASAYLDAAAGQLELFHFDRARELLLRGIELAIDPLDRAALRLLEGRTLHEQGLVKESMQSYQLAIDESPHDGQRGRAWLGLAMGMRLTDDLDGAFDALARAEPLALQSGVATDMSELHYLRGNLHFPRGELEACLEQHGKALEWAQQGDSAIDEARALSGLGDAHYARSHMQTAQGYFERCMELCRVKGFGRIEAANGFMVATVRMYMNELDAALDDALQSAELGRRVGHQRAQIVSRLTAGWIYLLQAQTRKAEEQVTLGLEVARELGAPRFQAFLLESVARIRLADGDPAGAMHAIGEAWELAQSANVLRFIGPWICGTRALVSQDADIARASLSQGKALIDAGCVGHNYFWFYKHAMQTCLEHGWRDAALGYAQRLEGHTRSQPAPWADVFIERCRLLVESQPGQVTAAVAERAQHLLQVLQRSGHHEAAQALRLRFSVPALPKLH